MQSEGSDCPAAKVDSESQLSSKIHQNGFFRERCSCQKSIGSTSTSYSWKQKNYSIQSIRIQLSRYNAYGRTRFSMISMWRPFEPNATCLIKTSMIWPPICVDSRWYCLHCRLPNHCHCCYRNSATYPWRWHSRSNCDQICDYRFDVELIVSI